VKGTFTVNTIHTVFCLESGKEQHGNRMGHFGVVTVTDDYCNFV
jgi:hypothetical protein